MARVRCMYSGIEFKAEYVNIGIDFYHPIFAAKRKVLDRLYKKHIVEELDSTESYLLLCAYLKESDKVIFSFPPSLDLGDTKNLNMISTSIPRLIRIIDQSRLIRENKYFPEPKYKITRENRELSQLPNWLKAWEDVLQERREGARDHILERELDKLESKLEYMIKSSGLEPESYGKILADWASRIACFPSDRKEEWKELILKCYKKDIMLRINSVDQVKELRDYCILNVDKAAGSIHSHELFKVLDLGITNHSSFLGDMSISIGDLGEVEYSIEGKEGEDKGDKGDKGGEKKEPSLALLKLREKLKSIRTKEGERV